MDKCKSIVEVSIMLRYIIVAILIMHTNSVSALEVPQDVVQCLQEAKQTFIMNPPTMDTVREYVDAEAALRSIRNPVSKEMIEMVYRSAYRFARTVYRESKKHHLKRTEMHILKYSENSQSRILQGRVGDPTHIPGMTRFTIVLSKKSRCRASNFIVASFRGMLDDVPRK
ncbi:MAG: hypothetical protein ACKKL4_01235 [Patescibacteria group bacterium]